MGGRDGSGVIGEPRNNQGVPVSDWEYPLVVESWLLWLHHQPRILQMAGEHANRMGMVASSSGKSEGRRAGGNCWHQMHAAGEKNSHVSNAGCRYCQQPRSTTDGMGMLSSGSGKLEGREARGGLPKEGFP